jgi:hypothetical protein
MAASTIIAAIALSAALQAQDPFQSYQLPIGLTVCLPTKPEPFQAGNGDMRKAFLSIGDDAVYFISDSPVDVAKLEELSPDQQIAGYLFAALSGNTDRRLVRYSDVLMDGWPGVEFAIEDKVQGETISSRCFAMNGHLVEFGAIYASGGELPAGLAPFFASIKQSGNPKYGPVASTKFGTTHIEPDGVPMSLDFPGDVTDEPLDLSKDDLKATLHRFEYSRDMRTFNFSYMDLPDGAEAAIPAEGAEQLRTSTLESIIESFGATLKSSSTEQRDGNDWLTGQFDIKGIGYGRVDVLYFKGRVYTLIAIGPEPWQESPEFKKFFDSFEIKN